MLESASAHWYDPKTFYRTAPLQSLPIDHTCTFIEVMKFLSTIVFLLKLILWIEDFLVFHLFPLAHVSLPHYIAYMHYASLLVLILGAW